MTGDEVTGAGTADGTETTPTVLAVDDEEAVTEAYALWLEGEYTTRTATSGEAALSALDETVDVVLLDRRMPGLTGDEVLAAIREEGYDCRVAMVTAVDPDFDVVDMPFDGYLTKPVSVDELKGTVERLLALATYEADTHELFSLAERRAVLEEKKTTTELDASEEYAELTAAIERKQVDANAMEFDHETFTSALGDLNQDPA